ncbi:hypothetical protein EI42_05561, partial [Thermosporothrix hazakensis]
MQQISQPNTCQKSETTLLQLLKKLNDAWFTYRELPDGSQERRKANERFHQLHKELSRLAHIRFTPEGYV